MLQAFLPLIRLQDVRALRFTDANDFLSAQYVTWTRHSYFARVRSTVCWFQRDRELGRAARKFSKTNVSEPHNSRLRRRRHPTSDSARLSGVRLGVAFRRC